MENNTNQQLTQMMNEIQSIKSILYQKKPVLHVLLHPRHLKFFMLLTGISIAVFALVFYYIEQQYGSFKASPHSVRQVFSVLATVAGFALVFLLILFGSRSLRKDGGKFTGEHVWAGLFSFRVFHVLFPIRLLALGLILYCILEDMAYYAIPVLSMAIGLQFNFLGCITETRNYVIGGYWFMGTALIILLNTTIPGSLAVLLSLGCGSLLFGLLPTWEK